jgi:hypothetical protein
MSGLVCPYCDGKLTLGVNPTADIENHLRDCPDYERPMTIDDMLEHLGSQFRVGR